MKIPNGIRNFIVLHVAELRDCLCLNHFKVDVEICNLKDASMAIEVDYRYLDAQILIDRDTILDDWHHGRKMKILESLAHELAHILTGEMSEPLHTKHRNYKKLSVQSEHFEERVTEQVSRLAVRLYLLERKVKI